MARPGMLTRGRANRMVKTPGGNLSLHRKKYYTAKGKCAIDGTMMQLPSGAKRSQSSKSSLSSKRSNRPYGGVIGPKAMRRGIISQTRG
jgi:large subunit ribosomal protein L34e